MNENINLIEILKDCPEGTEFYSAVYGKIRFMGINSKGHYPIKGYSNPHGSVSFTADGKVYCIGDSECLIFPSKEQRDWNVWKEEREAQQRIAAFNSFEDGDFLAFDKGNDNKDKWVFIYRKTNEQEVRGYACLSTYANGSIYVDTMDSYSYIGYKEDANNLRYATVEERKTLRRELKKQLKMQWNAEDKTIEIIPNKVEMSISSIEAKLGLEPGTLRIKK